MQEEEEEEEEEKQGERERERKESKVCLEHSFIYLSLISIGGRLRTAHLERGADHRCDTRSFQITDNI